MVVRGVGGKGEIGILGMWGGMEVMNGGLGGRVYEEMYGEKDRGWIKEREDLEGSLGWEKVELGEGSVLRGMLKGKEVGVNCLDDEGVKEGGGGLGVWGRGGDGVIEGIERRE